MINANIFIQHIRQVNKGKLIVCLFSFLIFIAVNNFFINLVRIVEGKELLLYVSNRIECGRNTVGYILLYEGFKMTLFLLLGLLLRKKKNAILTECFIAYFFYDVVFIGFEVFEWVGITEWRPKGMLVSSPQMAWSFIIDFWYVFFSVAFATVWTLLLFVLLKRDGRLSFLFVGKRLAMVPFSLIIAGLLFRVYFLFRVM